MLRLPSATVDLDGLTAHRDGVRYVLTPQEGELLRYLSRVGRVVSRDELLARVWGYAPGLKTRAVDATVSRLRAKIERDSQKPEALKTVRGKGYKLCIAAAPPPVRPIAGLLGRTAERTAILEALDAGDAVDLIGPGGAGKTTLARAICAEREGRFVDLQTATTLDDVVSALALEVGIRRHLDSEGELTQIVRALAHPPRLVVLDNVEQLPADLDRLVESLQKAAPLLLTSRSPVHPDHTAVELGPLEAADARELLAASAMRRHPQWPGAGDAELDALAEAADRLPLHLELVGAHLAVTRAPALIERLDALLAHGDGRPGRHRSRASVVEWSWSMLDPLDRRRLAWWSVIRGPLDFEVVQAMGPDEPGAGRGPSKTPQSTVIDTLARLHSAALLDSTGGHARMWVSVRAFASTQLDVHGERAAAEEAHATWFAQLVPDDVTRLESGVAWSATAAPWRADLQAVAERMVERAPTYAARAAIGALAAGRSLSVGAVASLLGLAARAAEASGDPHLRMGARLAKLDELRRVPADVETLLSECSELEASEPPVPLRLARMHHEASRLRRQGDLDSALASYRSARDLALANDRLQRVTGIDHDEAATLRRMGRLAEARALFQRSLAGRGQPVEPRMAALCLQALASIARVEGRLDEAVELGARAVEAARNAGDPYVLGGALTNHANALTTAGRHSEAVAVNREAITTLEGAGVRTTLSFAVGNLGSVLDRLGERVEAEMLIRRALALAEASGVPYPAAYWCARLADIAHRSGRIEEALEGYAAARARLDSAGASVHRVDALTAAAWAECGEHQRAQDLLAGAAALGRGSEVDQGSLELCRAAVAAWTGSDARLDDARLSELRADPELHVCVAVYERAVQRT